MNRDQNNHSPSRMQTELQTRHASKNNFAKEENDESDIATPKAAPYTAGQQSKKSIVVPPPTMVDLFADQLDAISLNAATAVAAILKTIAHTVGLLIFVIVSVVMIIPAYLWGCISPAEEFEPPHNHVKPTKKGHRLCPSDQIPEIFLDSEPACVKTSTKSTSKHLGDDGQRAASIDEFGNEWERAARGEVQGPEFQLRV